MPHRAPLERAILIALVVVLAIAALARFARFRGIIARWARAAGPVVCGGPAGPGACALVWGDPGLPPFPDTPSPGAVDFPLVFYAARLAARVASAAAAGSGGAGPDHPLLRIPGAGAPALLYAREGAPPMGAVWRASGSPETAVVAFRGTQSVADLKADIAFAETAPVTGASGAGAPRVHRGMYGVYRALAAEAALRCRGARRILVAGHSLGAALAFYLAFDALYLWGGSPQVYAVGVASPRPGDGIFADAVSSRAQACSVANLLDFVPSLPWGYMPGTPRDIYVYAPVAPVLIFSHPGGDAVTTHAPPAYLTALSRGGEGIAVLGAGGAPRDAPAPADVRSGDY